jgi:hypothetical protein
MREGITPSLSPKHYGLEKFLWIAGTSNMARQIERKSWSSVSLRARYISRNSDMDRKLLIGAALGAALMFSAAPAAARNLNGIGIPNAKAPVFPGPSRMYNRQQFGFHRSGHGHDNRPGFDNGGGGTSWGFYDLQSSYDDRDWMPESGNGWWHDRPDRAYPRWVQEQRAQGTCDPDRMWWSGTGWHC